MKQTILSTIALGIAASPVGLALALEEPSETNAFTDTITIIGTRDEARELPGSGALIDAEQVQIEVATDVNQLLKTVPGIYIREEDGYGLRPNIGIRAASSSRSGKVTLLEDGVMIAPAPYSNPAAYYFPTTMRVSTVEVLKGASLLRHGPQTTGGVVNLVSTPIPEEQSGSVTALVGEHNSRDLHAYYGDTSGEFGWLVETVQRDSDGFKDIDRSNDDTGFDIQDYVAKLGWTGERQRLLFKMQHSEEISDETYLGLTDADFDRDPTRRYGLSRIDQMDNDHTGFSLAYGVVLNERLTATAIVYHNEFNRNWFKLGGGGDYVEDANGGDVTAQGILDGTVDASGLNYKHNSRAYESSGLELNLAADLGGHQLAIGARTHEDEMDRFQPTEVYDQLNGQLVFQNVIQPGGSNNRLEGADALSFWITDTWQAGHALKLNLALRYEDVDSFRKQYDDTGALEGTLSNTSNEWLPGASFTYDLSDQWQVLAGVHRGFSPLGGGANESEDPEISVNYEAGLRFNHNAVFVEAIGFYSDFSNKTQNCSVANNCPNGADSGSFSHGEAIVEGIELQAGSYFTAGNFQIPLQLAYTYTEAEVNETNTSLDVRKGDRLADIPKHVFSLRTGLEHNSGWNGYAIVKYTDELCVEVGCNRDSNRFNKTESVLVVDAISHYEFSGESTVFLKVENLFDEQSIVSRSPDGARPNKPRTASVGVEYKF